MSNVLGGPLPAMHMLGLQYLKKNWGWYLGLGIALVVLGTIAVGAAPFVTFAAVILFGWLLIIGGVLEAVHAFWRKSWGGFFVDLFTGILYTVLGFLMVFRTWQSAAALTVIIAAFLIVGGGFRIVTALAVRLQHWGWLLLSGVINLVLGIIILQDWQEGTYRILIGLFIGIDMIFNGWSLIMLGLTARKLPDAVDPDAGSASGDEQSAET